MKYYYSFLLTVSLFVYSEKIQAQFGAQFSYIKPSGDFGYLFKPTAGVELVFQNGESDDNFRVGFNIGYYSLTARQDTFFSYGLRNGSYYLPAYTIWESYKALPLSLTFDYKFTENRLSPLVGLDAVVTLVDYEYVSELSTVIHETVSSGTITGGITARAGLQYELGEYFLLTSSFGKQFGVDFTSMDPASMWKMQIGIIYYPD